MGIRSIYSVLSTCATMNAAISARAILKRIFFSPKETFYVSGWIKIFWRHKSDNCPFQPGTCNIGNYLTDTFLWLWKKDRGHNSRNYSYKRFLSSFDEILGVAQVIYRFTPTVFIAAIMS